MFNVLTSPATGFEIHAREQAPASNYISLKEDDKLLSELGKEGYKLVVTKKAVFIRAATSTGIFYGLQTLRQLMPQKIYSYTVIFEPAEEVQWVDELRRCLGLLGDFALTFVFALTQGVEPSVPPTRWIAESP